MNTNRNTNTKDSTNNKENIYLGNKHKKEFLREIWDRGKK